MCLAPLILAHGAHVSYNSNRALVLLCEHADPTHDHRDIMSKSRRDSTCMRSASGGAASAWLEATPASYSTRLSTQDVVSGNVYRRGIGPQSSVPQVPCTCSGGAPGAACRSQCDALTNGEQST